MVDANQKWEVQEAIDWMKQMKDYKILWIEEPTNPDDVMGHAAIAEVRVKYAIFVQQRRPMIPFCPTLRENSLNLHLCYLFFCSFHVSDFYTDPLTTFPFHSNSKIPSLI